MRRALPWLFVPAGLLALAFACRIPNENHCLHKAADQNEWCAENEEGRPFCSPCVGGHHGCVKEEPTEDECPEYTVPVPEETGTDGGESGESGETGTDGTTGGDADYLLELR